MRARARLSQEGAKLYKSWVSERHACHLTLNARTKDDVSRWQCFIGSRERVGFGVRVCLAKE